MEDKVDSVNKVVVPVYGAITGGIMSWGEEFLVTIILAASGAAISTVVSHFLKKYLNKK